MPATTIETTQVSQVTQTWPNVGEEQSRGDYWASGNEFSMTNTFTNSWIERIREEVYKHPEVEALFVSSQTGTTRDPTSGGVQEPVIDYWIIIEKRDLKLVRKIVEDQQSKVVRLFSGTTMGVDFHICYRNGRLQRDLVPEDAIELTRP